MSTEQFPGSVPTWHGTTILTVRKGGEVVIAGDGQVSLGQTVIKGNAKKVRRLGRGDVIGGFAGATADAFTLFARLEAKIELYPGQLARACVELATSTGRPVFVSMSENGIVAAEPDGSSTHVPALRLRGPIDIVGAGDSVTANLTTALAAGAHLREALELAAAASSHVIHQLGTTGTASVDEIETLISA
jgi:ATP-dependent protease HslVU peptidase subunit